MRFSLLEMLSQPLVSAYLSDRGETQELTCVRVVYSALLIHINASIKLFALATS